MSFSSILGESSIGSGVRRVEALVGGDAYRFLAREHVLVAQLSEALKVRPEQLPERVNDIVDRLRVAEKEIEQVRRQQLLSSAGKLVDAAEDLGGVSFVGHHAEAANGGDARTLALDVRGRMPAERPSVAAVIGSASGKPSVVVAVNDAARASGISANALVRNSPDAAALEVTLLGPELEFDDERVVAVTGAQFDVLLDGRTMPPNAPFIV